MSDKTQAMGSTVHTNHQLGGNGERALIQCFEQKFIPGVILHISHQSFLTTSQKSPADRAWTFCVLTWIDGFHPTFRV